MGQYRIWLAIVLMTVLLLTIWAGIQLNAMIPQVPVPCEKGVLDLTGIDLTDSVASLGDTWDFYPDQLYESADITAGVPEPPTIFVRGEHDRTHRTGTHRAILHVTPGRYYSLAFYSLDYAMRMFVNGVELVSVGVVADTAKDSVPRVAYLTVPFFAHEATVEIILQYANYVHHEGGNLNEILLSSPRNIERVVQNDILASSLLCGGLIMMVLYYFGSYIVHRRREVLFFALICLVLVLRDQRLVRMFLPEQYNWQIWFAFFYSITALVLPLFIMLINSLFPQRFGRLPITVMCTTSGLFIAAILFLPSIVYTQMMLPFVSVGIPIALYYLVRMAVVAWKGTGEDALAFAGVMPLLLSSVFDMLWRQDLPIFGRGGILPVGMLVFAMTYMFLLAQRAARAEQDAGNLKKLNALKTDFLMNISHEMKTPLTVMSVNAQMAMMDLQNGAEAEAVCDDLMMIDREAHRLSQLVNNLLGLAVEQTAHDVAYKPLDISVVLTQTVMIYKVLFDKKGNRLHLHIEEDLPQIMGNADELQQVIINLLQNANTATKNGDIAVSAVLADEAVSVLVQDNGIGMSKEFSRHAFDRFISGGADSPGLGLSICKQIIQEHGGTISIRSKPDVGTVVRFTLPARKEATES